jgi:hypothetical protein
MRLIESSKDSLLRHQANKGYTQNTVDRVYAAIRAMAEGSKTLKIQEIRDRYSRPALRYLMSRLSLQVFYL